MFNKILIANRGEIACRIIKTARRLGITTVAIYSTADRYSRHVTLADEAYCVGAAPANESYLNIAAIIKVAMQSGTEAIHPGYGFLSENPLFAQACIDANIIFIGPSIQALETMGSKQLAKQLLEQSGVPLTPGYHGEQQSDKALLDNAIQLGFPVLLKAANGGGGKGMRAVYSLDEFDNALAGARREANAYFADDTMLIEKLVTEPRHIEMQIMADNYGNIVHLFERDCSIQRRHQKIIEEAPANHLSETLRQQIADAAIAVARAIHYRGAGTVEFLVTQDQQFYFMEMNTRLQVEHPVTEMITGIDLVEWQLRIAAGEPLPQTQAEIQLQGHAIECRICAEDPQHNFLPSIGQIHFLKEPLNVRIDTGIVCNDTITMYYDPMIAKLIVWGETRETALRKLRNALMQYHIGGVKTNIPFLQGIIEQPDFISAHYNTNFLTEHSISTSAPDLSLALLMAASIDYLNLYQDKNSLNKDTFGWQMHLTSEWRTRYSIQGQAYDVLTKPINETQVALRLLSESSSKIYHIKRTRDSNHTNLLYFDDGVQSHQVFIETINNTITIYTAFGPMLIERFDWQQAAQKHAQTNNRLTAPMPATVVAVLKQIGDRIKHGDSLMVLEAMKMEHTIHAPTDGVLEQIFYKIGEQVQEGAELITIEPNEKDVIHE